MKFTTEYGTVPFSILARHAFVAENLLRSLVRLGALNFKDTDKFKTSFDTITSKFIYDLELLSKNEISFHSFKKKYGHLRPGTYDINSKTIQDLIKIFL